MQRALQRVVPVGVAVAATLTLAGPPPASAATDHFTCYLARRAISEDQRCGHRRMWRCPVSGDAVTSCELTIWKERRTL